MAKRKGQVSSLVWGICEASKLWLFVAMHDGGPERLPATWRKMYRAWRRKEDAAKAAK